MRSLTRVVLKAWKNIDWRLQCMPKQHFSSSGPHYYAQPTPKTHSHLLKCNEIMPGLTSEIFHKRRQKLMKMVLQNGKSDNLPSLVLIPSSNIQYMSGNIPYPFRQNTDFLYLCGFKEPNSILLLYTNSQDALIFKSVIFIPKGTAHSERWEGPKMDLTAATNFLGVSNALYLEDLEKFLVSFAKSNQHFTFYYDFLKSTGDKVHQLIQDFIASHNKLLSVESPRRMLHQLRVLKCESEASLMRKTCKIAAESLLEVMKFSKPMIPESHLQARMDYECRIRGADYLAFPPVVAGGDQANVIHYVQNNHIVNDGDMVLMDAGCEYNGYTSDLARTWPVNGKFTEPQKELYALVLSVQEELIQICKKRPPLDHLFKLMCESMGQKLQRLGLIPSNATAEEVSEAAYEFCPHHVGHYLGMDVHDTNLISRAIGLLPGMVVTIEPGIYISKHNTTVPEKYRGICIRIEDDILITSNGLEVLTSACPKHIEHIENFVKP